MQLGGVGAADKEHFIRWAVGGFMEVEARWGLVLSKEEVGGIHGLGGCMRGGGGGGGKHFSRGRKVPPNTLHS